MSDWRYVADVLNRLQSLEVDSMLMHTEMLVDKNANFSLQAMEIWNAKLGGLPRIVDSDKFLLSLNRLCLLERGLDNPADLRDELSISMQHLKPYLMDDFKLRIAAFKRQVRRLSSSLALVTNRTFDFEGLEQITKDSLLDESMSLLKSAKLDLLLEGKHVPAMYRLWRLDGYPVDNIDRLRKIAVAFDESGSHQHGNIVRDVVSLLEELPPSRDSETTLSASKTVNATRGKSKQEHVTKKGARKEELIKIFIVKHFAFEDGRYDQEVKPPTNKQVQVGTEASAGKVSGFFSNHFGSKEDFDRQASEEPYLFAKTLANFAGESFPQMLRSINQEGFIEPAQFTEPGE